MLRLLIAFGDRFCAFTQHRADPGRHHYLEPGERASYTDGTNTFNTVSNTVTVTVSKVSGLAITPDGASNPTVVAGQTAVLFNFTVPTAETLVTRCTLLPVVPILAGTGSATITRTFIDVDNSGTINVGDTTLRAPLRIQQPCSERIDHVLVEVSIGAGNTAGQTVQVILGDAAVDNQASNGSANEVRTFSAASVNGTREAKGDITVSVENDARLVLNLDRTPRASCARR